MGFKEFAEKTGRLLKQGVGLYDKVRDWDNHNNRGRLQKVAWKGFKALGTVGATAANAFIPGAGALLQAGVDSIYSNRMKDVRSRRKAIKEAEKSADNQTISTVSGPQPAPKIATNPVSNPISSQATAPVAKPAMGPVAKPTTARRARGSRRRAVKILY